jgi:hypothetical protein
MQGGLGHRQRRPYLMLGEVVENVDPEGLGRVRIHVPGILEPESLWAFPCGAMHGVKNGIHWVPEVGSNGVVWLNQGDPDHPYFMPGPWGAPAGVSDLPEQSNRGDPNIVVFRWRDFVCTVDGRVGREKTTFQDLVTGSVFELDRVTGNFSRTIAGPTGNEAATIKGNLTETIQTGNEVHTVSAGSRTTSIGAADARTVTGAASDTIGGAQTTTIGGSKAESVGGASSETIALGKTIAAILAVAISAGLGITLTAAGALQATAAGISLNSSGTTTNASTGLVTSNFLGGLLETIVGAVARSVTGAVTETVSGLWTMVVNGGLLIQGAAIQIGTGAGGYKKLLNESFLSLIHLTHTHPLPGGGNTGQPNAPSPADVISSETTDLTAT